MSRRIKKISLIIISLSLLAGLTFVIIPLIMGFNNGYDGALIEGEIKDNCNCKNVAICKMRSKSHNITDYFTGEVIGEFNIQLSDCKYETHDKLLQDILAAVKKEDLCLNKDIEFTVTNLANERMFIITNCSLKIESGKH